MSVGSPELSVENLDSYDNEHLVNELKKAKEELFNLRFQKATGQLESHGRILAVKKDIARIYTFLKERELEIRTEPSVPVDPADVKKKNEKESKKNEEEKQEDSKDDKKAEEKPKKSTKKDDKKGDE